MRSGKMRYRVQVQRPADEDSRRGTKTKWHDVKRCWAAIKTMRVAEGKNHRQLQIIGSYEIRIWGIEGIDETWRLVHGQHAYNFIDIDQPNLTVNELVIVAKRDKLKKES